MAIIFIIILVSFLCADSNCTSFIDISSKVNSMVNFFDHELTMEKGYNPDVDLNTLEMIKKAGYRAEAHLVATKDGYLLTMHRIRGSEKSLPIFLQHGLLGSSADWVISGKEKGLAYMLADRGYDVWMGNVRGNTYSKAHKSLSPSDSRFWNFSWHEIGINDLPAMITYVTQYTKSNLTYIGHSMGTTVFYVMVSQHPRILEKCSIQAMFSLAPIAFMNHLKSPIRIVAPFARDIQLIIHYLGEDEFLPQNSFLKLLARYGCDLETWEEKICANVLYAICGFDQAQFNSTLLPVILSHTPAGASTKTLVHYAQEIISGKFRPFDYGKQKNTDLYNSTEPPDYDLSKLTIPVALFYADNDWLASPIDVARLYEQLPNKMAKYRVPFPTFNHLDFIWGLDAPKLVYEQLFVLLQKYTK
ncbi:lipase 3-like [Prorops nasuta]|uniref:lipase 3-like n=1 Tax=Prorops nasuta TaxID=863751 RepID=UPI0034CF3BB8